MRVALPYLGRRLPQRYGLPETQSACVAAPVTACRLTFMPCTCPDQEHSGDQPIATSHHPRLAVTTTLPLRLERPQDRSWAKVAEAIPLSKAGQQAPTSWALPLPALRPSSPFSASWLCRCFWDSCRPWLGPPVGSWRHDSRLRGLLPDVHAPAAYRFGHRRVIALTDAGAGPASAYDCLGARPQVLEAVSLR